MATTDLHRLCQTSSQRCRQSIRSTNRHLLPSLRNQFRSGLPGNLFNIIQVLARCSLAAIVTVSASLLIFICLCGKRVDTNRAKSDASKARQNVKAVDRGAAAVSTKGQNENAVRRNGSIFGNAKTTTTTTTKELPFWKWNIGD